ncbi:MAG: DUF952 domain-containing protein [Acidimicrobiales bacterium]
MGPDARHRPEDRASAPGGRAAVDPDGRAHTVLVHLATPEGWRAYEATGTITPPSLATEGFVHLSTLDQAPRTAARHFAGRDELVLLLIDPDAIPGPITWAESHPGEHFPHHHAPIPLEAVVGRRAWPAGPDGDFPIPPGVGED